MVLVLFFNVPYDKGLYVTILPLLGSVCLYAISRKIIQKKLVRISIVKRISAYTFGLYLYADSLNYLILALCKKIFGLQIFASEICTLIIYMIRILGASSLAMLIVNFLKRNKCKLKLY